ncbi:MAG: GTPase HflX [Deltaproteobacteria bacterium]|nr:GTPase HflX [Deltaproteobacteria bacterium]
MAAKLRGNLNGLKPSQIKSATRLYDRKFPNQGGFSLDQARELAKLTAWTSRQIGILVDRKGTPVMVIVGDHKGILIPELTRYRHSTGRLSGLRLVHTHLGDSLLSQEDLMDMVFLRLDSVCVLSVVDEEPARAQWAHLLPPNADDKPYSVSESTAWSRVEFDFLAQAEALEDELARTGQTLDLDPGTERALLVSVDIRPRAAQETELLELSALAKTAGVYVAGTFIQRVTAVNPRHILGKGKLAELEVALLQKNASLVIFNAELSPTQMRNLSLITERRVIDRTQLILDIFAQHASTRAGKLQVEMAQLKYTLPRLIGQNRALSRLAGGIGGRGPGETRLELDRRKIRDRIAHMERELEGVRRQRKTVRARRTRDDVPIVGLVGYTNAGKSTLLNTLTDSKVLAEDKLFATLDPTSRRLRFPEDREVIFTDTVGFIRALPKELKQAFMATLEELSEADLLLHVLDAGHPEASMHVESVNGILEDLGLGEAPRILVLNKWDLLDEAGRGRVELDFPDGIPISATDKSTLTLLTEAVLAKLGRITVSKEGYS